MTETAPTPMAGFPTSLGTSQGSTITLLGRDLATDLIGKVGFGEIAYWLLTTTRPTPEQCRLFEATLLALVDHGFTPTAIAARLTYLSAPDAIQGALAAGLLGGGSRYLGVTEDTGHFLANAITSVDTLPDIKPLDELGWDDLAAAVVKRQRVSGKLVPGLGHPIHKMADPRTAALVRLAHEENLYGPHLALFEAIGRVHPAILGSTLPLNGAGVCGATLADLGIPPSLLRGVALLARCAGLLGHLAEEIRQPVANDMYLAIDRNARYQSLRPDGSA